MIGVAKGSERENGARTPESVLAEAAWLLAAAVVPLAFSPVAVWNFLPAKSVVVCAAGSMCWLALAAAALRALRGGREATPSELPGAGAALAALAVLLSAWVSSVVSVDRSLEMAPGPMASFAPGARIFDLGIFLGLAAFLRTPGQAGRLAAVLVASSLPAAGVVLLSRYGAAGGFPTDGAAGVVSHAGGPLLFAGYMAGILPLGVWGMWRALRGPDLAVGGRWRGWFFGGALVLGAAAFFAAEKRGPMLALMAGAATAVVLGGLVSGNRRRVAAAVGALVACGCGLLLLAWLFRAGVDFSRVPWVERLALVVPVSAGSGDLFRNALWREVPALIFGEGAFRLLCGAEDPVAAWRWAFGFGPDTGRAVLPSVWVWLPAWPRLVFDVSAHNIFWDLWIGLGVFGLAAICWVVFGGVFGGLRAAGLVGGWQDRAACAGSAVGAGVAGGAVCSSIFHAGYFGLGFAVGLVAGMVGYAVVAAVMRRGRAGAATQCANPGRVPAAVAFLAGFVAVWVDAAFVFFSGNTNFLFWLLGGALVGLSRAEAAAVPETGQEVEECRWFVPSALAVLAMAVLSAMAVVSAPGAFLAASIERLIWFPLAVFAVGSLAWVWRSGLDLWSAALCTAAAIAGVAVAALGAAGSTLRVERDHFAARQAARTGDFAGAERLYARVLERDPARAAARAEFAPMLADRGRFDEAFRVLRGGLEISAMNELSHVAGDLYSRRAFREPDATERLVLATRALHAYRLASGHVAWSEPARFEAALLEREIFGRESAARRLEAEADRIAETRPSGYASADPAAFGAHYARRAISASGSPAFPHYLVRALAFLDRAVGENRADTENPSRTAARRKQARETLFWAHLTRSSLRSLAGDPTGARLDQLHADALRPEDVAWSANVQVDFRGFVPDRPGRERFAFDKLR